MLVTRATCPRCHTALSLGQGEPPGKRVQCLKCGSVFEVPAQANGARPSAVRSAAPVAAGFAPPPGTRPGQPAPVRHTGAVPAPNAASGAGSAGVLLIVGALGLLLLVGVGAAAYCFLAASGPDPVARATDPATPRDSPPDELPPTPAPPQAKQQTPRPAPVQEPDPRPAPRPDPDTGPPKGGNPPRRPLPPPVEVPKPPPPPPAEVKKTEPPAFVITKEHQENINKAIDAGVLFLQRTQQGNGTWTEGNHKIGYAALPGLTLLECGAKPTDPAVQRAAHYVRFNSPDLTGTYELALAVLFLDKLGDKRDRVLIQTLALRLIAGQNGDGGWTYTCPKLDPNEATQLYAFLTTNRPLALPEGVRPAGKDNTPTGIPTGQPGRLPTAVEQLNPFQLPVGIQQGGPGGLPTGVPGKGTGQPAPKDGSDVIPSLPGEVKDGKEPGSKDGKEKEPAKGPGTKTPPPKRVQPIRPEWLKPSVQKLAVVTGKPGGGGDNSNTQFAMIALWAARRHDVPMERTLYLVWKRFQTSQLPDGKWSYGYKGGHVNEAMTCVGLIGLAIGHGNAQDIRTAFEGQPGAGKGAPAADPTIQKGLKALGNFVDNPKAARFKPRGKMTRMANLYFLWSLERVAVLYNLKTIGSKDWYGWASQMLVDHQKDDGSWDTRTYHGSSPTIDTCLALLILRRANLTQDLSDNIGRYLAITDPDGGAGPPRKE